MNAVVALEQKRSVLVDMSAKYGMEPAAFEATVRATCIKPDKNGRVASREEFAAFLLVAKQYDLNPLTKQIYAFTDRGGVIPIVGVDGWSYLINSHPQFDGMSFVDQLDGENLVSVTCKMFRKDRTHPIEITEYMVECKRDADTWKKWPRRMLRHKAMIQTARYAFSLTGIYDPDEAARIIEARSNRGEATPEIIPPQSRRTPPAPPPAPEVIHTQPAQRAAFDFDAYRAALKAAPDTIDAKSAVFDEWVKPNQSAMTVDELEEVQNILNEVAGPLWDDANRGDP